MEDFKLKLTVSLSTGQSLVYYLSSPEMAL